MKKSKLPLPKGVYRLKNPVFLLQIRWQKSILVLLSKEGVFTDIQDVHYQYLVKKNYLHFKKTPPKKDTLKDFH